MPVTPSIHEASKLPITDVRSTVAHRRSPRLASPQFHYLSMTDFPNQPCLSLIPPRRCIAHLRRRPISRRRRATSIPRRRRRNIIPIPIAIRGTVVAPSRRTSVVSPCVAVVVSAAASVMMVVVVTAGIRRAVVVGVAVAGSSRTVVP